LGCDLGFIEEAGNPRLQHPTRYIIFALRTFEMKNSFLKSVRNFLVSEDGPTAVEYAVMLALIVIVCLASVSAVGSNANAKFNKVKTALS
jgi:pilus assembly protein Flp/PilA